MKKVIKTTEAPSPIGPYNQAILVDNTLYASGQIAMDQKTMKLVNENIQVETTQVMKNLSEVLKAAGMGFANVVKATIYLADMGDFSLVNEVYAGYFNDDDAPARETVQVAQLPKNVRVEISVIAIL